jgi:hypothetical protein
MELEWADNATTMQKIFNLDHIPLGILLLAKSAANPIGVGISIMPAIFAVL